MANPKGFRNRSFPLEEGCQVMVNSNQDQILCGGGAEAKKDSEQCHVKWRNTQLAGKRGTDGDIWIEMRPE